MSGFERKQNHFILDSKFLFFVEILGCVRLGNPDLDFQNLIRISQSNANSENGFHLREIRPQGGFQLGNPNPDFLDFPFCRSIGKSEKGFAKLFS